MPTEAVREAQRIVAETEPAGLTVYETRIFGRINHGRLAAPLADALRALDSATDTAAYLLELQTTALRAFVEGD